MSKVLEVMVPDIGDFEGVEIQGELVRPQGSLILDRKRAQFNSMIKLRTDFDDEMDKSVDEIK